MQRYRLRLVLIAYAIFLIADCLVSNIPILSARDFGFTEKQIVMSMFAAQGYFGRMAYMLVSCPFIIVITEVSMPQYEEIHLLRYRTKTEYYIVQIKQIVINSVIFMLLHELIMLLFLVIYIDPDQAVWVEICKFLVLDCLMATIYYVGVLIMYIIMGKLIRRKLLAMIVLMGLIILEYNIAGFSTLKIMNISAPYDIELAFGIFNGKFVVSEYLFAVIRELCINVILGLCGAMIEEKRDILDVEK